jgi:hypothetical protein
MSIILSVPRKKRVAVGLGVAMMNLIRLSLKFMTTDLARFSFRAFHGVPAMAGLAECGKRL